MGLDCFVQTRTPQGNVEDLWYGRKTNEIHGWMQQQSGIPAEEFNCVELPLTSALLESLEMSLNTNNLTATSGFFFGTPNDKEDVQEDGLRILKAARNALNEGKEPYYTSWW